MAPKGHAGLLYRTKEQEDAEKIFASVACEKLFGSMTIKTQLEADYTFLNIVRYLGAFDTRGFCIVIKKAIKSVSFVFLKAKIKRCIIVNVECFSV